MAISARALAAAGVHFEQLIAAGDGLLWIESRPAEGGRRVIVRRADASVRDLNPAPFSAGSRVYEYGGGAVTAADSGVWFVNREDQAVYAAGEPPVLLAGAPDLRFGGLSFDPARARLLAVAEERGDATQPAHWIAAIDIGNGHLDRLVNGAEFYMHPRASTDGRRLAWVEWAAPNMPWDGCELWVADVSETGDAGRRQLVAGGRDESAAHPVWAADGTLYYLSDLSGWWSLWTWDGRRSRQVADIPGEMSSGAPAPSRSPIALAADGRAVVPVLRGGESHLAVLGGGQEPRELPTRCTWVTDPVVVGNECFFLGGSPTEPLGVRSVRLDGSAERTIRPGWSRPIDLRGQQRPYEISAPTPDGGTTFGTYHRPFEGTWSSGAPPLIVQVHGGPVASNPNVLLLGMWALLTPSFWTSRGYAVLDLAYHGTVGYGRAYRTAIRGRWGEVDVADAVAAVEELARRGLADSDAVFIRGASAGGSTTLMALTTTRAFRAGASYFPVVDQVTLAERTHKFEAHYNEQLIGPWPAARDRYVALSPITHAARLSSPLLVFQGSEDRVCPEAETRRFVETALRAGRDVTYRVLEGEAHGFVRAENIAACLEAEADLYARLLRGVGASA